MNTSNASVHVFDTHDQAESAIRTLSQAGFDMSTLSLVGKGYHTEEKPMGFYTTGDKVRAWGGAGAFWGGIWGLLLAPAVFVLPGVGVVAMAGPFVAALIGALEGAVVVGSLSALGAALSQIGVSPDQLIKYETALKMDKYLLVVNGRADEQARASTVLAQGVPLAA
jgi:hypothetical protein